MAQIKMDISEYEEMKKNTVLLEESLDREKKNAEKQAELRRQIEKVREEKMKALEDAQQKIVRTTKTVTREHVVVRPNARDLLNSLYRRAKDAQVTSSLDFTRMRSVPDEFNFDNLFEVKVVHSTPNIEEVEFVGLESAKEEIRKEYMNSLDEETKYKLKEFERLHAKDSTASSTIKLLEEENSKLDNTVSQLEAELGIAREDIADNREYLDKLWKIITIMDSRGLWPMKLNKIKAVINR